MTTEQFKLTNRERIELFRARRWLKKANRDIAKRVAALSRPVPDRNNPEEASHEFLRGVQLLAAERHFRDKLLDKLP